MTISATSPGRGRAQLVLLAILFLAPFAAAWVLYFYFPQYRPSGTSNYGSLIHPVRPVPSLNWLDEQGRPATSSEALRGKWTLLHRVGERCEDACVQRLVLTRQTQIALPKEHSRIQRVVLMPDLASLNALRRRLAADEPELRWFAEQTPGEAGRFFSHPDAGAVYLVDPLGNYLMVYPAGDTHRDFKGMQKDLKKLLKLSQIG